MTHQPETKGRSFRASRVVETPEQRPESYYAKPRCVLKQPHHTWHTQWDDLWYFKCMRRFICESYHPYWIYKKYRDEENEPMYYKVKSTPWVCLWPFIMDVLLREANNTTHVKLTTEKLCSEAKNSRIAQLISERLTKRQQRSMFGTSADLHVHYRFPLQTNISSTTRTFVLSSDTSAINDTSPKRHADHYRSRS
jgi:hypothetical protein